MRIYFRLPKTAFLGFILAIIIICLTGYYLITTTKFADLEAAQKRNIDVIGPFDELHSYYQTILSPDAYFSDIEFSLLTRERPDKRNYHIFVRLTDCGQEEISIKKYKVPNVDGISDIKFSFVPQGDSTAGIYCLFLKTNAPPGSVAITGSRYDSYGGGLYTDFDFDTGHDLSFFAYSKPPLPLLIKGTLQESGLRIINIFLISLVIFCLGYTITSSFSTYEKLEELFIYAFTVGLAIPPTLFFALGLLNIKLDKTLLIGIVLISFLATAFTINRQLQPGVKKIFDGINTEEIATISVLLILSGIARVIQISNLHVPSGVGAQFHQRVLEGMVSNQELSPDSIYHMGFHANVFFVKEILNTSIPEATLIYGQWLSIISGLTFYLLARQIFKNPMYAAISTSLYWFVSPFPSYLINIARYPFLQGLVILPAVITLLWKNEEQKTPNRAVAIIISIGLFLSHYGTMIILILLIAWKVFYKIKYEQSSTISVRIFLRYGILFSPVLLVILLRIYFMITQGPWETFLSNDAVAFTLDDFMYVFSHTLRHGGIIIWLLGCLGFLVFIKKSPRLLPHVIFYAVSLFILDLLQYHFLGHSASNMTNLLYTLFIPLPLLAVYGIQNILRNNRFLYFLFLGIISLAGSYNISGIVNPRNVFFSQADQDAMSWISNNTAPGSVFAINSYPWDDKFSPSDGGYWITSMTGRTIIFPKTFEFDDKNELIRQLKPDYIYIGSGFGSITPDDLNSRDYLLAYNRKGIYIYAWINDK